MSGQASSPVPGRRRGRPKCALPPPATGWRPPAPPSGRSTPPLARVVPLSRANEKQGEGGARSAWPNGQRELVRRGPIGAAPVSARLWGRGRAGRGRGQRGAGPQSGEGGADGRRRRPMAALGRGLPRPPLAPPKLPESQVAPGCAAAAAGGGGGRGEGGGWGGCGGSSAAHAAWSRLCPRWAEAAPRREAPAAAAAPGAGGRRAA